MLREERPNTFSSEAMTERDALHAAICANPDDDTPRLVFADWLDEHGEHFRAEFIRVQIEAVRLPVGKKRAAKEARAKELLDAHEKEWAKPIKRFVAGHHSGTYADLYRDPLVFRRGFVEVLSTDAETFCESADDIFASAPIRELRFDECGGFDDLAKCKHLLRVRALDLSDAVLSSDGSDAPALFRSKYLANLVSLTASGQGDNGHLDNRGLMAIANSKHFQKLERLDVGNNWMFVDTPARTATVTRNLLWRLGANMPALRELQMNAMELKCDEVSGLVGQPWVSRLRKLDLSGNEIGEAGVRALCASKRLANLEELDLRDNISELPAAAKRELKARFGKRVLL